MLATVICIKIIYVELGLLSVLLELMLNDTFLPSDLRVLTETLLNYYDLIYESVLPFFRI